MATLRSKSGRLLTDEALTELTRKAEEGFDAHQLRGRPSGRPPLGDDFPSPRIQVRVPRPLYRAVTKRAHEDGTTVSALVRQLLEHYTEGT